jgi:pimeloyl-ACP methyl ester carboxylesterase
MAVPIRLAANYLGEKSDNLIFPAPQVFEALKASPMPVHYIGGDNDISFHMENWYVLHGQLPTLELLTFPRAGHAPLVEIRSDCAFVPGLHRCVLNIPRRPGHSLHILVPLRRLRFHLRDNRDR